MPDFIGYAYASGTIEFSSQENPWAFRRMDTEMKAGQENRIKFDPTLAPVVIRASPNVAPEKLTWMKQTERFIQTANTVYLQRSENSLRFRQAIHRVNAEKQIIMLGSHHELDHYVAEHFQKIHTMYASRMEGFQFNLEKVMVRDRDHNQEFETLDLQCRIKPRLSDGVLCLGFDATGANSQAEIINWRGTINNQESGKLVMTDRRLRLVPTNYSAPLTLCEEYHPDTKCRWYIFSHEVVQKWVERSLKSRGS